MAERSIQGQSNFNPLTFEDLSKPMLLYKAEYDKQMEALGELDEKASVWENMADQTNDPIAYARYKTYADLLAKQRDNLASNGLSPSTKASLMALKSNYNSRIKPIEDAYKAKNDYMKAQNELNIKSGGKILRGKDYQKLSIDSFLNGATPDIASLNTDDLYKESVTAGTAISSRYFNTTEGKAFNNMYKKIIQETGMSPEQTIQFLTDPYNKEKFPELNSFIDNIKAKYKYGDYDSKNQGIIDSVILEGLNTGFVYKKSEELRNNLDYLSAAEKQRHNEWQSTFDRESLLKGIKKDEDGNYVVDTDALVDIARAQAEAKKKLGYLGQEHNIPEELGGGTAVGTEDKKWRIEGGKHNGKVMDDKQLVEMLGNLNGGSISDTSSFAPLEYKQGAETAMGGRSFEPNTGMFSRFNPNDAKEIPYAELSVMQRAALKSDLEIYGLTPKDVTIYEDYDILNRNHYRVVLKGRDANNNVITKQSAPTQTTPQNNTKPNPEDELNEEEE